MHRHQTVMQEVPFDTWVSKVPRGDHSRFTLGLAIRFGAAGTRKAEPSSRSTNFRKSSVPAGWLILPGYAGTAVASNSQQVCDRIRVLCATAQIALSRPVHFLRHE
jgi:hypothetical protein